jgi:hypothetical protein
MIVWTMEDDDCSRKRGWYIERAFARGPRFIMVWPWRYPIPVSDTIKRQADEGDKLSQKAIAYVIQEILRR